MTSRDSADVFANTSSWTVLETCLRALERFIPAAHLQVSGRARKTGQTAQINNIGDDDKCDIGSLLQTFVFIVP